MTMFNLHVLAVFDPISWIIMLAISLGIQYALSKSQDRLKHAGLDSFEANRATLGEPIPVVFGTTRLKGLIGITPIFYLAHKPIKKTSVATTTVIGYKYYVSMQLALGHANVNVLQFIANGKCCWPTVNDFTARAEAGVSLAHVHAAGIFGDYTQGGGIDGKMHVLFGGPEQVRNAHLVQYLGSDVSCSRGITTVVLEKMYVGTSGSLPQFEILGSRTQLLTDNTVMWYVAKADIDGNMNIIHAMYEIMTSPVIGRGISTTLIGDSFVTAADVCYEENLGVSFKWKLTEQTADSLLSILQEIADCVLYQDMGTGKFEIAMHRPVDVETLDTYDESDFWVEEYESASPSTIPPYTVVQWWDTTYDKQVPAYDDDIAMLATQGYNPNPQEFNYQMIRDGTVATQIAARKQLSKSCMPHRWRIHALQSMSDLHKGSAFIAKYAALGITSQVVRVAAIDYGTVDDNDIVIELLEDPYSTSYATFANPPASEGEFARSNVEDLTDYALFETPFYSLVKDVYGASGALGFDANAGLLSIAPVKPASDYLNADVYVQDAAGGDFSLQGVAEFCPTALIDGAIAQGAADVTVDLTDEFDLDLVEVGSYAMIGAELFGVVSVDVDNSQVVLSRGALDTVPISHADDSRVYFVDGNTMIHRREYLTSATPAVKFCPRTDSVQLPYASATTRTAAAFAQRQARPYPPGNFKVDGAAYPVTFIGEPTLTWSHRDRTDNAQVLSVIKQTDTTDYGPEASTTYEIDVYDENDTLVRSVTGLTGKTYTYTEAMERADCSLGELDPLNTQLSFHLRSKRDGLASFTQHEVTVLRGS